MSRKKRPSAATEYHNDFLYGTKFANNPANNREAVMERMYFRILSELAANRFKWEGLPDEIDVRFMEVTLLYRALSVFYFDTEYDKYFALQGAPANQVNMLQNPTAFVVVGNDFVSKTLSYKKCVPIWANYMRTPDLDIISIYAHKLANVDRTVEINVANARQNKVVAASDNQRLSMVNINRQIDEGQNLIQVNGAIQDMAFIQALDLGINPDLLDKVHILRTRLWNECMGLLGIDNANQDKKERLVSAEVDANDDQTANMRYVNLNARRKAADDINKMFPNLNVTVSYHTDDDNAEIPDLEDDEAEPVKKELEA